MSKDGNQICFPRNRGVFDREGQYAMMLYRPAYKYPDQAWFCLGVKKVTFPDGTIVGRRAKVFDYTCKKIVTIRKYEEAINSEIMRVRCLKPKDF